MDKTIFAFAAAFVALATFGNACPSPSLEDAFLNPPIAAKPHTWYHLMNGNVTREGITCDFEELARVGLGGVQMFDAGCAIPPGDLKFNSPEWFELVRHAENEAQRLGLEICIANCSGWSSSGGPWNPPSNGMKRVVHTVTAVRGPTAFCGILPRTKEDNGYYADIAVLAVPDRSPAAPKAIRHAATETAFVEEYEKPEVLCGVKACIEIKGSVWMLAAKIDVETSADGIRFERAASRQIQLATSGSKDGGLKYVDFGGKRRAKAVRIRFDGAGAQSASPYRITSFGGVRLPVLAGVAAKTFEVRAPIDGTFAPPDETCVRKEEVVELTGRMGKDGSLSWDVPAGDWKIIRLGAVCTGSKNRPASDHGVGLEVDKLSAEALNHHFDQYATRICDMLGKRKGGNGLGFNNVLVDSFEVGSQNWTGKMEAEFLRRRGYALRPYLPSFAGVAVGSLAETERFFEDYRRTVADLFAENYAGAMREKCHARGLMLSLEPYGNCPADNLQYGQYADVPMAEFWSLTANTNFFTDCGNAKYASYLAHFWGKKYCATESFTAEPGNSGRWRATPFAIKTQGDHAFAAGVNRIVYHRFAHQPWPGRRYVPGMTMGHIGMHLDRTQTWWDYAKPWFRYQAVCQSMLQRGTYKADFLFFCGEEAPNQGGNTDGVLLRSMACPAGFSHDVCATDAIYALQVGEDGKLVSPGGVRYAVLVLPEAEAMTPKMLKALLALADRGGKISGRARPVRAPGLSFGKAGDADVKALAAKLWGHENFILGTPEDAIRTIGLQPDVRAVSPMPKNWCFDWIHRGDKGANWYFVCTANQQETEIEVSFRQVGKVPELWDAETGTIADAAVWREEGGRTRVTIPMSVSGSKFVVFRRPSAGVRHVVAAKGDLGPGGRCTRSGTVERTWDDGRIERKTVAVSAPQTVEGSWEVEFPHGFAPNGTPYAEGVPEKVVFPALVDWAEHATEGVRYFSGTAVYSKEVTVRPASGERAILDLGDVKNVAEVTVNGKTCPALWKPPFRVDITDAVKADGKAALEIRVANLWANRLIGDDRTKPPDCEWTGGKNAKGVKMIGIRAIPDWVRRGEKSPTGRFTFTTWKHWDKDDALQPSGLIGPAVIRYERPCAEAPLALSGGM